MSKNNGVCSKVCSKEVSPDGQTPNQTPSFILLWPRRQRPTARRSLSAHRGHERHLGHRLVVGACSVPLSVVGTGSRELNMGVCGVGLSFCFSLNRAGQQSRLALMFCGHFFVTGDATRRTRLLESHTTKVALKISPKSPLSIHKMGPAWNGVTSRKCTMRRF